MSLTDFSKSSEVRSRFRSMSAIPRGIHCFDDPVSWKFTMKILHLKWCTSNEIIKATTTKRYYYLFHLMFYVKFFHRMKWKITGSRQNWRDKLQYILVEIKLFILFSRYWWLNFTSYWSSRICHHNTWYVTKNTL